MSDVIPTPIPAPAKVTFFAKARKAFAAGGAGAVTGIGTACTTIALAGNFTPTDAPNDFWIIALAAVGGFAVAFGGVYATAPNVSA